MTLTIDAAELFGVTESSFALTFTVRDGAGNEVDADAEVRVDGQVRATTGGSAGTRSVRVEGLAPDTEHRVEIRAGAALAEPDAWFPGRVRTLPHPTGGEVASFATLNDLHFGEPRFGGAFADGEWGGPASPEFPEARADDTEVPYWRFMNDDAVAEINEAGVDATIIKGDIADRGLPEQFEDARSCFAKLGAPHHAFLGNHDHYGLHAGLEVDGYELLGQPRAPRGVDLGGWRLVLLETARPGEHHGELEEDRLAWLDAALAESRDRGAPTLVLMHHHPVPPEFADRYPNTIGIRPEHSLELFELIGRHPHVRAVLIGHTHRNRVRLYPTSGATPFVEVNCTKDYPGGWAHYRLFDDGSFRQEVRRTASERALAHSSKCATFFRGGYRRFSFGRLEERSFGVGPLR